MKKLRLKQIFPISGHILRAGGWSFGLVQDITRWVQLWKCKPVWDWIFAARSFRNGEFMEAARLYQRGLKRFPKHPASYSAHLDYAYCLLRNRKPLQAQRRLENLLNSRAMLEGYLLLSRTQEMLGDSQAAFNSLAKANSIFADHADVQAEMVLLMLRRGSEPQLVLEIVERLRALRRSEDFAGQDSRLLNTALAAYDLRYGEPSRGEKMLARLLSGGTAPLSTLLLRAEIFFAMGRLGPARNLYRRILEVEPFRADVLSRVAETYLHEGSKDKRSYAKQLAEQACSLSAFQNARILGVYEKAALAAGDAMTAELMKNRRRVLVSTRSVDVRRIHEIAQQLERIRQL